MSAVLDSSGVYQHWSAGLDDYPVVLSVCGRSGRVAVGESGGRVSLFGRDGTLIRRWRAHADAVMALAWNPSTGDLLSGGQDGCARLWRGITVPDHEHCKIAFAKAWVDHVAFNPQGTRLAACAGREIIFANADGEEVVRACDHASTVTGLAWRPNGEQVVTACYGGIQYVRADSALIKRRFKWSGSLISLALSPDGNVAACGCQDNSVHFWRLASGVDAMMSGYAAKPALLSWRADSGLLAVASGAEITLWSFEGQGPEGMRPETLDGHDRPITTLAFAPRGACLVSGCRDGEVLCWLPGRSARPVFRHSGDGEVTRIAWACSDESSSLVIAFSIGEIHQLTFRRDFK